MSCHGARSIDIGVGECNLNKAFRKFSLFIYVAGPTNDLHYKDVPRDISITEWSIIPILCSYRRRRVRSSLVSSSTEMIVGAFMLRIMMIKIIVWSRQMFDGHAVMFVLVHNLKLHHLMAMDLISGRRTVRSYVERTIILYCYAFAPTRMPTPPRT